MVKQIIDEINKCLDADLLIAALALSLTLPDICGKAEYTDMKLQGERYKKWYDDYLGPVEVLEESECPQLTSEVLYSIRNCILHQGTPTIDISKIKNERDQVTDFKLVLEDKNVYGLSSRGGSSVEKWGTDANGNNGIVKSRTFKLSVRHLCLVLSLAAEDYYNSNREKFGFIDNMFLDKRTVT